MWAWSYILASQAAESPLGWKERQTSKDWCDGRGVRVFGKDDFGSSEEAERLQRHREG